tara:strand:- start:912 stop:1409 length:498 start_codon:yes stop_codon:yes gene_type:complete
MTTVTVRSTKTAPHKAPAKTVTHALVTMVPQTPKILALAKKDRLSVKMVLGVPVKTKYYRALQNNAATKSITTVMAKSTKVVAQQEHVSITTRMVTVWEQVVRSRKIVEMMTLRSIQMLLRFVAMVSMKTVNKVIYLVVKSSQVDRKDVVWQMIVRVDCVRGSTV